MTGIATATREDKLCVEKAITSNIGDVMGAEQSLFGLLDECSQ